MKDYKHAASPYDVDTVFFGGGTPTALPVSRLLSVLGAIRSHFALRGDAEITVEANPATVNGFGLRRLRRAVPEAPCRLIQKAPSQLQHRPQKRVSYNP